MSVRNAMAHRNLLYLLSLKELRTRYRESVLGWAWSLLNPLSQMLIFSIIFLYVFKAEPPVGDPSGLQVFPLYFLVGLIPFQFFSITVTVAMGSVRGGAGLIKKVSFPHEHLVFSVVIAQFVTMLIELGVLSITVGAAPNPCVYITVPMETSETTSDASRLCRSTNPLNGSENVTTKQVVSFNTSPVIKSISFITPVESVFGVVEIIMSMSPSTSSNICPPLLAIEWS